MKPILISFLIFFFSIEIYGFQITYCDSISQRSDAITVLSRSSDPDGSLGLPLDGPFTPGETVSICVNFDFGVSSTQQTWLHGIIPLFGDGWDRTSFDPEKTTLFPLGFEWTKENSTTFTENIPQWETYVNNDGYLNICDKTYMSCPNVDSVSIGDYVPGAWFWNSIGNSGSCGQDSLPQNFWGIPQPAVNIYFCLDLRLKERSELDDNSTFFFGFQGTTDSFTGCWDDPSGDCIIDALQLKYFDVDFISSTKEAIIEDQIFPNPTTDLLNIETDLVSNMIQLLDLNGKVLIQSREKSLSLGHLENGVYILNLDGRVYKVIKN